MMNLRMISAQPAIDYYTWQVEVYLTNFISLGYNGNNIDVVAGYEGSVPDSWRKLQQKFPYVRFFFYEDTMGECKYLPAIQAHLLKKHFKEHPYLSKEAIFFHDADFVFTRYMDFSKFLNDDKWYFSDTISYIGYDYIMSKGEEVLDAMCDIIGIDKSVVKDNQLNSGGAQKLFKNIDYKYWEMVEEYSNKLHDKLSNMQHVKKNEDPYGIQSWTASMWAELWTGWKLGHQVVVPPEFDFCWATCPSSRWEEVYFFHNAGVPSSNQGMFYKAQYMDKLPFNEKLELSDSRCSYMYYNIIESVDSCLV